MRAAAGRIRTLCGEAAHQHRGRALGRLAHHQPRGRGDRVRVRDLGDLERAALRGARAPRRLMSEVTPAAPIATFTTPRRQARPKLSLMMTPGVAPQRFTEGGAQCEGRALRVLRQEQHALCACGTGRGWSGRCRRWP